MSARADVFGVSREPATDCRCKHMCVTDTRNAHGHASGGCGCSVCEYMNKFHSTIVFRLQCFGKFSGPDMCVANGGGAMT